VIHRSTGDEQITYDEDGDKQVTDFEEKRELRGPNDLLDVKGFKIQNAFNRDSHLGDLFDAAVQNKCQFRRRFSGPVTCSLPSKSLVHSKNITSLSCLQSNVNLRCSNEQSEETECRGLYPI
jgi:hypothetical protein